MPFQNNSVCPAFNMFLPHVFKQDVVIPLFCVAAAHCLHTVTEDNPELLCSLNVAVLRVLESVLLSSQPAMAHTLLRTLAAGTHCHFFFTWILPSTHSLPHPGLWRWLQSFFPPEWCSSLMKCRPLRDSVEHEGQSSRGSSGPDTQCSLGHLVQLPWYGRRYSDTWAQAGRRRPC